MVFLYFFHFVFIHTLGAGKVTIPSSFLVYLSFVICYNLADTKKENCMFNRQFNTDFNPNQTEQFGMGEQTPYTQGVNEYMPQPLPTGMTEQQLYPLASSLSTPQFNNPQMQNNQPMMEYKKGGKVKKKNSRFTESNPYPTLAELIRQQGQGEDTILAHINPLEARILGLISGNDTLNPVTGLPQFFFKGLRNFIKNPIKTIGKTFKNPKRTIADSVGWGSAIFGGPIGGAIGGAARSVIRGDKENPLIGTLKGAGYGTAIPGVASLAGSGLSSLGANGLGQGLKNYSTSNMGSWMGNMGQVGKGVSGLSSAIRGGLTGRSEGLGITANNTPSITANTPTSELGFTDKLVNNSKDFFTQPSNILATAAFALPLLNKPKALKEKSPEQLADEHNRYRKGTKLTKEERAEELAIQQELAKLTEKSPEQLAAEKKRYQKAERLTPQEVAELKQYQKNLFNTENFLPQEQINFAPRYRKQRSPEEHEATGRWFSYYDNPQFTGEPMQYAEGGSVEPMESAFASMLLRKEPQEIIEYEEEYPIELSAYIQGDTGGQDDEVPAMLSDGEYVIDASTVADLGDGNNAAGAKLLDKMVKNVRLHKRGNSKLPTKAKSLADYILGK